MRADGNLPALLIRSGPSAGRRIELTGELVVGRRGCDLDVEDHLMSRRHARFARVGGDVEVEDLGSTNGTWVNTVKIDAATRLRPGDLVQIGATAIELESAPADAAPPAQTDSGVRRRSFGETVAGADELRPVTALFADVVGSTSIGERLRPEEVKALIGECVTRMAAAVERFGGVIDAFMGDGIAAFFGMPHAHEDDADRAARAALQIVAAVGEYARDIEAAWGIPDFNVRVGIQGGQVAVGLVGGEKRQTVALGDSTNVAARLQGVAAPGTIVVGEPLATQLHARFVLEPLGEVSVKGRSEPVAIWRLDRPRSATYEPPSTPLVGRDPELARLALARDDLLAGRGRVLFLLGEAGMGKTRLLSELRALSGDAMTWLQGTCVSYGREFPFFPVVEALRWWLGVNEGDAPLAVRTRLRIKLEPLLGADGVADVLYRLESLLSGSPARPLGGGEDPAREIVDACRTWIEALAASMPVALVFDDFQWADPWTCALADELLETVERSSLLLGASLRVAPDSDGWRFRVHVLAERPHRALELPLEPLSEADATRLLSLLRPGGLSDDARAEIVARSEGNPLYIEQLLHAVSEGGDLVTQPAEPQSPNVTKLVPRALESLLLSRLDNLPAEARRLAQVAAVSGRSFSHDLLEAVHPSPSLEESLGTLVRTGILRELRRHPQLEYSFSHGLLRDAALTTLTRARRRELYGRVAAAYEELFSGAVEEHLDLLAHYYGRSDDLRKALHYLERAAEKALGLRAGFQVEALLRRAQAVAAELGDADAERRIAARLEERR